MLFDIQNVVVLNSQKQEIGSASGKFAIRPVFRAFIDNGEGKVLVLTSPTGEKVSLAMSHGGDLQIECP